MNILIYRWNAYNQQDIEETFQSLGIQVELYTKQPQNIEQDEDYICQLTAQLRKGDYAFLFSVNYFPVLAIACAEAAVPYVCWTCDSPLIAMYHTSVFLDTNFIFVFDRHIYEEFKQAGCRHIFHLPLAANTERLSAASSKTDSLQREISFIGSLYDKNSYDPIEASLPDYLCGYLEGALQAQSLISGGNLLPKLLTPEICNQLEAITDYRQSEDSFSDLRLLFSTTVLGFKAASITRRRFLKCLAARLQSQPLSAGVPTTGKGVHLFTDSSDTLPLPLVHTHPPVDYHTEMSSIFRSSKINLNMTIPNIQTGIPLRVWDILSSGGFLLTDLRSELLEHFTPGKEFALFEDEEELCFQAEYYLRHEEERCRIRQNAMENIRKNHSLRLRLVYLLQEMKH